mgnify:CR=1 FL=1
MVAPSSRAALPLVAAALLALGSAHDVFVGTTTIDCATNHHACETSGTVLLGPGETFSMNTEAGHDVETVSIGFVQATQDEKVAAQVLHGVATQSASAVSKVRCELEPFSVVWFCATHKDMVMPGGNSFNMTVPQDAKRVQFVAWGSAESAELVLGWTVQRDGARTRDKAGGMPWGVALGLGSGLTLMALALAWRYYRNADDNIKNICIINVVALVSHVWYVTIPLGWATNQPDVGVKSRQSVGMFYFLDVMSVIAVLLFSLGPLDTEESSDVVTALEASDAGQSDGVNSYLKEITGVLLALLTVAMYVVTAVVHLGDLWYALWGLYASLLLVVAAWSALSGTSNALPAIKKTQQYQCAFLFVCSLIGLYDTHNRFFYAMGAAKWFLGVAVLQVLAVQSGAVQVDNLPPGVLWSAVFISAWAVLAFDVTSYGVAAVMVILTGWNKFADCIQVGYSRVCVK